jgi:hypothetical protein
MTYLEFSSTKQEDTSRADLECHSFTSPHSDHKDNDDIVSHIISLKEFLELPDKLFYCWLKIRLELPVLKESNQVVVEPGREYWRESYTIDQLFREISSTIEIVTVEGKKIGVRKYYNRALKIFRFINITKSNLDFIINFSDLSPRLIAELKVLDKMSADYVLKQAVGGIFENIDSKRYHSLGFAKKLVVRLDR